MVLISTWPSQSLTMLTSFPDRSRCMAVVWRMVCGLTVLVLIDGQQCRAAVAYLAVIWLMPKRVIPTPLALRNRCSVTSSLGVRWLR